MGFNSGFKGLNCHFSSFCNSSVTKRNMSRIKIMTRHDIFPHQNCTPSSHSSLITAIKLQGRQKVCHYCKLYKNIYLLKFTSLSKIHCIVSILCVSSYVKIPEVGSILNVMAYKKKVIEKLRFIVYYIVTEKSKELKHVLVFNIYKQRDEFYQVKICKFITLVVVQQTQLYSYHKRRL